MKGKYDWFYEGFALYQSLKTAVATNRIRFDDYLDTLSRAYSIDARQSKRLSLIDASKARFAGNDTQVYARGMIVAFLTDLTLMEQTKGKVSIANVLARIMQKHPRGAAPADGNEAVTAIMRELGVSDAFIESNIKGNAAIEWNNELSAAGIQPPDGKAGLSVAAKLNGRQKALLDKLGYNNWRKLSR
jgi:predicted metalloprotease with PDZ domain